MSEADRNLEFVQTVADYPCLYNTRSKDYSRKDLAEKSWSEIGKKMKWSVPECKEKWRNMRNGFVRSIKISGKSKRPYYLHDAMTFIIPYLKRNLEIDMMERDGEKVSNKQQDNRNEEFVYTDEPSLSIQSTDDSEPDEILPTMNANHFKRKLFTDKSENKKIKSNTDNPRMMFLLSLLPDIEKLSDTNMRLLKIDMMTLIQTYNDAEEGLRSSPHPRFMAKSREELLERMECPIPSTSNRLIYGSAKASAGYDRDNILVEVEPSEENISGKRSRNEASNLELPMREIHKWEQEDD